VLSYPGGLRPYSFQSRRNRVREGLVPRLQSRVCGDMIP
jgi:hypothetical protein